MPHPLFLNLNAMPLVNTANFCRVSRPVLHPDRILPFHVLVYIMQGDMQIIEDDTVYQLVPDSLLFLKSGVHHWGRKKSSPDTAWYYVHFYLPQDDICEAANFQQESPNVRTYSPEDYSCSIPLPKMLSGLQAGRISEKLKRLTDQFHSPDPYRLAALGPMLGEILLECVKASEYYAFQTPDHDRIALIQSYLETHSSEPLDMEALGVCAGLSSKYAGELFKRKTGMTLLAYHTALRMNEAARLLRETPLTSAQISERLGYAEPFYFSSVFKKVKGMSPRDYRNSVRSSGFSP